MSLNEKEMTRNVLQALVTVNLRVVTREIPGSRDLPAASEINFLVMDHLHGELGSFKRLNAPQAWG